MKRVLSGTWCLGLLLTTPACSTDSDRDDGDGGGAGGIATVGGADDSAEESSGDDDGGFDDDIRFDIGGGGGNGPGGDAGDGDSGCTKVDFLFVIDNSGSMADEQQNLIDSFPAFIDTIQTTLADAQDYHLMVIDVDAWIYDYCLTPSPGATISFCDAVSDPFVLNPPPVEICENEFHSCATGGDPLECQGVLGAGVTYPTGMGSSERECSFASGARYIDSSEPDLAAAFTCAAQVGVGSTHADEKPMEAMVAALNGTGEVASCNEGFLRDDAILVVTFVTDENDDAVEPGTGLTGSAGTEEGWKQAVVAAKNGNEDAVVMLGLFGDQDEPNPVCGDLTGTTGAEPSPRLRNFINLWGDRGISGSVCAPSYQEFFQQAVDTIDTTCEDFIPPG